MPQLFIELFSEEIPARMQLQAARDFERLFDGKLKTAGLSYESLKAYVGPRRLSLVVEGLPVEQAAVSEEVKGPKEGAPGQAMQGFLRKVGLTQDQLVLENGVWVARIEKAAKKTVEALPAMLEDVILNFPWPKSMRSGTSTFRWVRPLKRIIFLFDGAVVPFELEGLTASDLTEGHRFLGKGQPLKITDFASYRKALADDFVILDHAERQSLILERAKAAAEAEGYALIEDQKLLEEVAGLNEFPVPLLGDMDSKFLDLPYEVIQTSMRVHQKYFAIGKVAETSEFKGVGGTSSGASDEMYQAEDGSVLKLAAKFMIVANMQAVDGGAEIKRGNAKVLSARLSDAVFFWKEDNRPHNFEQWLTKLSGVTFHAKLGTMAERVARIEALAGHIAPAFGVDAAQAQSTARLAKADLASYMVGEFPELQGVMGGYYAAAAGLGDEISSAIRDHYKPQGPSDSLPATRLGAVLALADKIDTLVGFFAIDEKPTGSKDPFALRRAALGVLRILREYNVRLDLSDLVANWYQTLLNYAGHDRHGNGRAVYIDTEHFRGSAGPRWAKSDGDIFDNYLRDFRQGLLASPVHVFETDRDYDLDIQFETVDNVPEWPQSVMQFRDYATVSAEFAGFFLDRLKVALREENIPHDVIEAALGLKDDDLVRVIARVDALNGVLTGPSGEDLVQTFKRSNNIWLAETKKAGVSEGEFISYADQPQAETELTEAVEAAKKRIKNIIQEEKFTEALLELAALRKKVDDFLDEVLVNADVPEVRHNRLRLVGTVQGLIGAIADLSRLS
jgi:glycyl-tRNA synthetase beta chain